MVCKRGKILVVGDVMLDSYHFGKVNRISPEAPVPVFLEIDNKKYVLGGASNVAVNIAAAGIEVDICSVIGNDENGKILISLLEKQNLGTSYIKVVENRITTNKLRYIGQNNQQILRVDTEDVTDVEVDLIASELKNIENNISQYSLFVISDYMKGFMTEKITQSFIAIANKHNIPVLIDVKDKNYKKYHNATLLKPNLKELQLLMNVKQDTKEAVIKASSQLCCEADVRYVLTTLGAEGMYLVGKEGLIYEVKSVAKEVFDVTGAGDTTIAYLSVGMVYGKEIEESVRIANAAAGVQVTKLGTSVVYPDEVRNALNECKEKGEGKIIKDDKIADLKNKLSSKKLVFTNGCFDIVHAGHISYLKEAKKLGDVLIVALNSDASIKCLKGKDRPINPLSARMEVIAALECVDYVMSFEEDTPLKLIEKISPDVLVKGGDYKQCEIVGAEFVKASGGDVEIISYKEGFSTTSIINKLS